MLDLQKELGMGMLLITHDLGVSRRPRQRVIVMYAGKKVEEADVRCAVRESAASLYARADGVDSGGADRGYEP